MAIKLAGLTGAVVMAGQDSGWVAEAQEGALEEDLADWEDWVD